MPTKLIENRINESGITDFVKGFASGIGDSLTKKLGIENKNDKLYKETMTWFKQHKLEVSSIPGIKADVLSATLGGQKLDIVINQNGSKTIYIKLQGIVCPFNLMSSIYSSWQDSDTQYLFDYGNMMEFHRREGEDKEYRGNSRTKYKLINTTTQNFYILYGVVKDFNIPLLNPNKVGINPSEYNKHMLEDEDVTGKKVCDEFLVKYMFALIYVTYNTPDKLIDFANTIGATGVEELVKDEKGALDYLIRNAKNEKERDTQTAEFQKKLETQPRKLAVAAIVRQIFET